MTIAAGTQLERYEILSALGSGGMGEVYLAEDSRLNRVVALKILPQEVASDADRIRRFEQEARTASALNHPNILTIYEIGETTTARYIATEFIAGETLREKLQRKKFTINEALNITIQTASALSAAHKAGIFHRDIKPENIMIREDNLVKVLDFGLAKLTEKTSLETEAETRMQVHTQAGMIMGTANYMSPEQARGKEVDTRTDIWSLGCVLYEMLAGNTPFEAETISDTIAFILTKEPRRLSEFVREIPTELEQIVFKLLRKDRDERYNSAKDLLADLQGLKKRLEFEVQLESSQTPEEVKGSNEAAQNKDKKLSSKENATLMLYSVMASSETMPPNNLSTQRTTLIGREKESAEIIQNLRRDDVRLLTLTGVGGMGKTALAQTVAQEMLVDFKDGVYFIELGTIRQPELVASTIAQPLGVKAAGGKPILEVLKDFLSERDMLLVVDNFEQVIDAAQLIAELLATAPRLKILVTSRALLHLSLEREFIVPPLAVPDNAAKVSFDELSNCEAIKLFVERARFAKATFSLTSDNVQSVADICVKLDGLPLAIELAAARVRVLSPQAILTKLGNRLKLLTGGSRDLPARQQTMFCAVEWSYDLLTDNEQRLFRWLAVFAGGFMFEAAETVCDNYELQISDNESSKEQIEVLELITSLVDKSLLAQKEQADGESRFRMLEVVREFALAALEGSSEDEIPRRNHAAYYLAIVEKAEPNLMCLKAVEWLNRLEEEHDNLRAALRWSLERDPSTAIRLAAAIRNFWNLHSHLTEGRRWLKDALERSNDAPTGLRFKLLNGLGLLARYQGDYETARKMYEKGLAEGRAANDLQQIAQSKLGLGVIAKRKGDVTAARRLMEEGLAISRELTDKSGIAFSLISLGDLARMEGETAGARPLLEESLTISKQLGNKHAISSNLINLGAIAYDEVDYKMAHSHFVEALATAQELGDKRIISYSLDGFAALATKQGNVELAAKLLGAAEHLREQIGSEIESAERSFRQRFLAELSTMLDEVAFSAAYEQGRKIKLEEVIGMALEKINFGLY